MVNWPGRAATRYGIGFLIVFFLILVFVPPLFKKRQFSLGKPTATVSPASLPVDRPFKLVYSRGSGLASEGSPTTLEKLFGDRDTLLINFWASWCSPCLEELPSLDFLARQLESLNDPKLPRLVTISVDETAAPIFQLFKTLPFTPRFPVLHDAKAEVAQQLGTTRFPETYLIDKTGKVLQLWVGPQDWLSAPVLERLSPTAAAQLKP